MTRVAASEADQLTVARALVGQASLAAAEGVVRRWRNMPGAEAFKDKIGPTAMRLMKSTLAKGAVHTLARRGGWRNLRFLQNGQPVTGRLWERHPPQALHFSAFSMRLIRWLTEAPIARTDCPTLDEVGTTPGDELLMYLAVDLCQRMDCGDTLAKQAAFRRSGLVWLAFPDVLAHHGVGVPEPAMFDRLLDAPSVVILEALMPEIADRWVQIELKKRTIVGGQDMIRLGGTQAAVASVYLTALEKRARRDLAQCFIDAAVRVLSTHPTAETYVSRLEQRGRIADRARARSAAGAFLRLLDQLGRWAEACRGVRFFDEDYEAAQLYLSLYEPLGDRAVLKATDIVRDLEALDATASEPTTGESS